MTPSARRLRSRLSRPSRCWLASPSSAGCWACATRGPSSAAHPPWRRSPAFVSYPRGQTPRPAAGADSRPSSPQGVADPPVPAWARRHRGWSPCNEGAQELVKLIIGIVRPERANDVLEALYRADVRGVSMSRVQGHGGELERAVRIRTGETDREAVTPVGG